MNWMMYQIGISDREIVLILQSLLFTAITGSVCFGVWDALKGRLEREGHIGVLYRCLKRIAVICAVPAVFGLMYLSDRRFHQWQGCLFFWTPWIVKVGACLEVVWFAGCLAGACRYLRDRAGLRRCLRGAFCCDDRANAVFAAVCGELGIREGRVRLMRCYGAEVPFLTGLFRPRVILPVEEYGEALRSILIHELTHYLHRDLWVRRLAEWVKIVYWFNPLSRRLSGQIRIWSEYACDCSVCERGVSAKEYFWVVGRIAEKAGRIGAASSAYLCEDTRELEDRILHMKRYRSRNGKRRTVFAVAWMTVTACCLVWGASSAWAKAYIGIFKMTLEERAYIGIFRMTAGEREEEMQPEPELTEYREASRPAGINAAQGEVEEVSDTLWGFDWILNDNEEVYGLEFYAAAGEKIRISVYKDPEKTVKAGISGPGDERLYVYTADGSHTFSVTESGMYTFFVANESGAVVMAQGSYRIR